MKSEMHTTKHIHMQFWHTMPKISSSERGFMDPQGVPEASSGGTGNAF